MVLTPDTLFHGRYCVVRCLTVGGMGAIYEVIDRATQSRRALKVLLPDTLKSADLRRRFEREATVTGSIESDHVVRTTDAGMDEDTGMPFLVMELLRGEELSAVVARSGHLQPDEAMLYLRQAALGLDKVHAAGIVHRDLKPENLFLARRDDGSPCLKIIDFGVAKEVAPAGELRKTRVIGTPLFMAPEQIRGDGDLGPGVDLYALGHVAYVLLAGEPYWTEEADTAASVQAFVQQIVEGPLEPPSARALRRTGVVLPPAFDGWFARASAPLPEQRFGRASAAVAALAEALEIPAGTPPRVAPASSGPTDADPAREPPWRSTPAPSTPQPGPLVRTTSALAREASERPPASSRPRFALPLAAVALLILGAAAITLGLRSTPPGGTDTARAAERDPATAAVPVAPDPAPRPASPPATATPVAPVDMGRDSAFAGPSVEAAPAAPGDAAPAAPAGASPSASAASEPNPGAAPSAPRPAPRRRPGDTIRAPHYPGID